MIDIQKKIIAGEYIGKDVVVLFKKNHQQMQGKIVDETKNTFLIKYGKEKSDKKKIIKEDVFIITQFGNRKIKIDGKLLNKRSEDRVKLKIKK